MGAWLVTTGAVYRAGQWAEYRVVALAGSAGFRLENLLVDGREYTNAAAIKAIINMEKGDPLFSFKPQEAQDMLSRLTWVQDVYIHRRLPDTIYISLQERTPLAIWQHDNKSLSIIDTRGAVLTPESLQPFQDLIILTGEDAPAQANHFMEALQTEKALYELVESAHLIGGRRWDLHLKNKTRVKLPQHDMPLALHQISMMYAQHDLQNKPIDMIDMRTGDKMMVTLPSGVTQTLDAQKASARRGAI